MAELRQFHFEWLPPPAIVAADFNAAAGVSLKQPLRKSVDVVRESIRENFDQEGRPVAWQALSQETIRTRESKNIPGDPILDQHKGAIGLKYGAAQVSNWTFDNQAGTAVFDKFPTKVWYGRIHQFGAPPESPGRAGRIPARPFLMIHPEDQERINAIFAEFVERKVAARAVGRAI